MANKIIVCAEIEPKFESTIKKIIESLKTKNYEFVNLENNYQCTHEAIDNADWILYFMTNQSISQDSMVIRNVKYAQDKDKNILPIMLESIDKLPMSLHRCQWVPFTKYINDKGEVDEKYFNLKIQEIDDVLLGKKKKQLNHKVFISYGHDKYADLLVKRIADDLAKRNIKVWIDYDYLYGSVDWEYMIQDGIDHCRYVLVFITEHSMRRPKGYCINEIVYSRSKQKQLIPIAIQDIDTPISIITTPQIDFSKSIKADGKIDENIYNENLEKIVQVLSGNKSLDFEDVLNTAFNPLDNTHYIISNPKYYGREWLMEQYDKWIKDSKSRVFCLLGTAGCGKTAFVSHLADKHQNSHAIHFCIYNHSDRADPKKALLSLAFHLSRQIPQYRDRLLNLPTLRNLESKNSIALFEYLFINPLWDIDYDEEKNGPIVLIIDALDETSKAGSTQNDFINLIVNEFQKTPSWLKLVVTSRPEAELQRKLKTLNPIFINTESNENNLDIKGYLVVYLTKFIDHKTKEEQEEIIDTLIKKSQGSFVYISKLMDDLERVNIDEARKIIDDFKNFPEGLKQQLTAYFERLFPNDGEYNYKTDIKPLMNVLCALNQPQNNKTLAKILKISDDKMYLIKEYISSLFVMKEDFLQPFHKSLLDWLPSDDSGQYHADIVAGHKMIVDYLLPKYNNNQIDDYIIKHLASHCVAADMLDEAVSILKDKKLLDQRIKLMGCDTALSKYFNEIYLLFQKDNNKAKDVLKHSTFLDAFGKYRKVISENEIYRDLSKMNLGAILVNELGIPNIPLEADASLAYYYMSYGQYMTPYFIFSRLTREILKNNDTDPSKLIIKAELLNLASTLFFNYCAYQMAEKYAHEAMSCIRSTIDADEYYELIKAYVNLGNLALITCSDQTIYDYRKEYGNALKLFEESMMFVKTDDDKKRFKQLELSVKTQIIFNRIWYLATQEFKFDKYHQAKEELNSLINQYKHFKYFNQSYFKCLCLDMMFNLYEEQYDILDKKYDYINSNQLSTENHILLEFIYALSHYFRKNNVEAKKHIKLITDDFMSTQGHFLSLTKICVLDLILEGAYNEEKINDWFLNILPPNAKNWFETFKIVNGSNNALSNIKSLGFKINAIIDILNKTFEWRKQNNN